MCEALRHNTVRMIVSRLPVYDIDYVTQVLTSLSLESNQITDQGAKDLAEALQYNKVEKDELFISLILIFLFDLDTQKSLAL